MRYITYMVLAAALAMLGKIDDAKGAVARLLAIQPGFTIARQCAAVDVVPALSEPLSDALRKAGLPE